MKKIKIPYGRSYLECMIPESNLIGVYNSRLPGAGGSEQDNIAAALDAPVESPRLEVLSAGKKSAVVISSDYTRPVPSRIIMPQILERLRRGSPEIDITILVATGFHRATTQDELIEKYGARIVAEEKIVIHDSRDQSSLVNLGRLPSGGELIINRLAVECDLLVAEGFIEPHFFAGFSGGRKSVLPGIASAETVLANHCSEFIQSPFARAGNLENNPLHRDMLFAAQKAGLAFIVNVVLDHNKRIIKTFAGDAVLAHEAGCNFLSAACKITVPEVADIVVTGNGGYPLDQNIYQAVKGMTAGEAVCRPGGVIVMVAACSDGHGGESFYENMANATCPMQVLERVAGVTMEDTVPDQWEFQILARILSRNKVIMVTAECSHDIIKAMHMEPAFTLEQAMRRAFELTGSAARVAVIPDGVSVIADTIKQN
ncbi:MAG: nickel-dependent lactate racemase [Victivallaceae bacterium]